MKHNYYLIFFLVLNTMLISCASDDDLNFNSEYETSFKSWLTFKNESANTYKYVVGGGSVFTDYSWETIITVTNGMVTQRDFAYVGGSPNTIPEDQKQWSENESTLNTHEDTPAAATLTLDEIYTKAVQKWLVKQKGFTSYFEAKNNGLISLAGYVEDNCADDCFIGIRILSITALD